MAGREVGDVQRELGGHGREKKEREMRDKGENIYSKVEQGSP